MFLFCTTCCAVVIYISLFRELHIITHQVWIPDSRFSDGLFIYLLPFELGVKESVFMGFFFILSFFFYLCSQDPVMESEDKQRIHHPPGLDA